MPKLMTGVVPWLDSFQRRHGFVARPLAVIYKYLDDQGGYLAALITYYGFLSLFPLLLVLITVLGFVLHNDPHLQQQALNSALGQFPIVGDQIGNSLHGQRGSIFAAIVGAVGSLYGGIGVVQAMQHTFNTVWAIPKNARPNAIKSRLRSLLLLALLGFGLILTTALSGFSTGAGQYVSGPIGGPAIRIAAIALAIGLNVVLFVGAFRVLTAGDVTFQQVRLGAVLAAIGWQGLQAGGTYVVSHQLKGASSSYGAFGLVLGLLAFIYVASVLILLCAETNVVCSQKLWPRSLLAPFVDSAELTDADERVYELNARAQRTKASEQIETRFTSPHSPKRQGSISDDDSR